MCFEWRSCWVLFKRYCRRCRRILTILIDTINQCRETRKSQDYDDHSIIHVWTLVGRFQRQGNQWLSRDAQASWYSIEAEERKGRNLSTPWDKDTAREKERKKRGEEGQGGGTSPAMYFRRNPPLSLPRDISTRLTIPTPKCTLDGRLHKKSAWCWTTY